MLWAVRAAVRSAHRPVVTRPRSRTAAPHPAMIHQPTWLAWAKPTRSGPRGARRAGVTPAPPPATPGAGPTWRLAEATAAATPAWERGIPDTAVLVIGAFTMPVPIPKIT